MTKILFVVDRMAADYTGLVFSYIRAFEKLGYDCELTAYNINSQVYRAFSYLPFLKKIYLRSAQSDLLDLVEKWEGKYIFIIKGYYLLPQTIDQIQQMNGRKYVFCFHPDDPFSNWASASNAEVRSCIAHFDAYFIWNRKLIKPIEEAGCEHVYYSPFAMDTDIVKPHPEELIIPENDHYAVSFIGNGDDKRIHFMKKLGNALSGWQGRNAIFGRYWKTVDGFDTKAEIRGNDYFNTIYKSKVNLNVLREQNKNSHNMRTFEIPGAGGFMLHEYSDEVADFFKEGTEVEFFRDEHECADKIKFYCDNDVQRNKIAKAGYEKIISAGYTYSEVVKEIEKKFVSINHY